MSAQVGQALGIQTKVMARSTPLFFHQTGGFEHLKMLGHSRAAHWKLTGEFADRRGPPPQQMENGLARRVRECSQHLVSVSHTLR